MTAATTNAGITEEIGHVSRRPAVYAVPGVCAVMSQRELLTVEGTKRVAMQWVHYYIYEQGRESHALRIELGDRGVDLCLCNANSNWGKRLLEAGFFAELYPHYDEATRRKAQGAWHRSPEWHALRKNLGLRP